MNLARLLFKPKWQDKDPGIRRASVSSDDDSELIAALPQLARADADASVRIAALKRLNDYEAWRERSTGDSDGDVRRAARQTYITLLCSNDAGVPALPRRIAELDTLSADELEKVATHARDHSLRGAALQRVTRPALLAERAVGDPDAQLRLAALERVTDAAALERIAERARKTDKAVSRRARELVAARRIHSGDSAAIAQRARGLCERMEALMRSPANDDDAYRAIATEWQALDNRIPTELLARYCGADALVRQTRIKAENPPHAITASAADVGPAESPMSANTDTDTLAPALLSVDILASQARFDTALATAAAEAQREREQRRSYLRDMEELTTRYANVVEAGAVSAAAPMHDRLLTLSALVGALPPALEARLVALHPRYDELKQQQLWVHRQRREALCDSLEGLAQAGLHPDALATRVREARDEWQRLDTAEHATGKDESGLSRRFHALCHRTLKPAKAYFDKRDELRRSHADEIQVLLQETAALPEQITDWKRVGILRQKLGEALRSLDSVDPRVRTSLAKRIKETIAQLAPRIDAHIESVESAKKRLIERAQTLSQQSDGRSIARDARELQQQWTALGNGRRGSDQRLWNEFRAACDAAFGKLDTARKERDTQVSAARQQTEGLLAEIEALQADTSQPVDTIKARLRDLDARWQPFANGDRALEQRYRRAHDAIGSQLQNQVRQRRLSRFTSALEKYAMVRAIETGAQSLDSASTQWHQAGEAATEFTAVLNQRYALAAESSIDGNAAPDDAIDAARDLLVELEFLAGIDSPAEDRARRMNYQVRRLASRMRDRAAVTPESELAHLFATWFAQAPQTADLEARFIHAAQAGIVSLP